MAEVHTTMNLAGLQIGWQVWPTSWGWIEKIVGLLITIFAVSLGAPFWFRALQKFMAVRNELAGKPSGAPAGSGNAAGKPPG